MYFPLNFAKFCKAAAFHDNFMAILLDSVYDL